MNFEKTKSIVIEFELFINLAYKLLVSKTYNREDASWIVNETRAQFKKLDPVLDFYESNVSFKKELSNLEKKITATLLALDSVEITLQYNRDNQPINQYWMM